VDEARELPPARDVGSCCLARLTALPVSPIAFRWPVGVLTARQSSAVDL